ncbi:transcriptional regulator with XRE-family HTH domain [Bradyrhizobium japonicum]|jgi:transcriptional regulator with XRE-family HTH domain|uniref:XRE family transcriptional regulator n=1 Tax=Bradyrhizobium japonicum TaxID=375 RepID=UPI000676579F|nr:LexA family transcriptional regulator [Bradyrhizobium japonicum]MCP1742302.1 transcriptional regulator with XRE-family HTH domain [Bradyrhizobium japonicum]MCP1780665.1 transcriptional regulator with XRE-family HTH domain [Bradyrhizobium japonicum]MCP1860013.1 transcriptional regulator with XRE-family HTH domain [Bradyrhizobium japonicum]MCP1890779.1 transcriptional regulator with XRE-family HTH domain [Bradyrhizobium japonicum]MCP1956342.1 transcriptional regulator with XRE-family HTH doma
MKSRADEKRTKAHPALETIKARIAERLEAAGLSGREASVRAKLGLTYANDILSGRSLNPTRETLAKLGTVLDTDADYFFGTQSTPRNLPPSKLLPMRETVAAEAPLPAAAIPLFQIGLTDPDGFFALRADRRTAWTSSIISNGDAYAITVPDDCMAPRYRIGEVVVVSPNKPVVHGGFALVRQKDDRVAIRQIVTISTDKITVRCLNGEADIDIPRSQVKALERIIGSCEISLS